MEESSSTATGMRQFSAFLSYSHADAVAVGKLHSKLEAYRLPKGLGAISASNNKSGGLGKVFRDREDLSAAQSLSDAVVEALGQSEVLVVVCSPDAKASRWVDQEIRLFRQLRPGQPILAAVVRGEPEEAFPAALTEGGNEPLAADLRKEGDGWKLGFLKVVAGIAGVPLDTLIQRDSQRHMRRVMAVTGVAMATALVMAIMTTVAIQSRNEAQAQRAEAEGLVGFMMTDLRDELRGVGRLDVMEGVNSRALRYYTRQGDLTGLSASSLEQRASILHALGDDELKSVDAERGQALSYFREAFRTTEATLALDPGNADSVFAHGQSQYYLGYAAYERKDWDEAGKWWALYRKTADRLAELEGTNERTQRETVYAEGNLCTLAFNAPDQVEKSLLEHCSAALDLMRVSIGERALSDKDAEDLINRLNWYAYAVEKTEGTTEAVDQFLRAEAIVNELIERDPKNLDLKDIWLTIQIAIARSDLLANDKPAAFNRLLVAQERAAILVAMDPSNLVWRGRKSNIEKLYNGGKDFD